MNRTLVAQIKDLRKNYFINADHAISQRNNTSFVSPVDGQYLQDRWQYIKSSVATHTVTRDSDVPTVAQAGRFVAQSMRLNLTAADTTIAIGDYLGVGQILEGYNWKALAQRPFTLSFLVKAPVAGTYCVAFRNSTPDRSYVAEYSIASAEVGNWVKRTITVSASPAAGTWNYTSGSGLRVHWMLACGSTFQTVAGTWSTGNFMATANQVNALASTGTPDFRIALPMINEGETAAPFRLFSDDSADTEIEACQRYCEKSYDLETNPGANVGDIPRLTYAYIANGQNIANWVSYNVVKRAAPSISTWDAVGNPNRTTTYNAGNSQTNNVNGGSQIYSAPSGMANQGFFANEANLGASNVGSYGRHWLADAELS